MTEPTITYTGPDAQGQWSFTAIDGTWVHEGCMCASREDAEATARRVIAMARQCNAVDP